MTILSTWERRVEGGKAYYSTKYHTDLWLEAYPDSWKIYHGSIIVGCGVTSSVQQSKKAAEAFVMALTPKVLEILRNRG